MPEQIAGLIVPVGIFVVFYFILIRPQQKRNKQINEMRRNLKVNDEIITIGGICGKITKIKDDFITIEVGADKIRLTVTKWAIGTIVSKDKD